MALQALRCISRVPAITSFRPCTVARTLYLKRSLMSEVDKAKVAERGEDTIFGKIVRKEIPAKICYEDEEVLAFHDVAPQAPVHVIVIPKRRIAMLEEAKDDDEALLGKLLLAARRVAKEQGLANGYRLVVRCLIVSYVIRSTTEEMAVNRSSTFTFTSSEVVKWDGRQANLLSACLCR